MTEKTYKIRDGRIYGLHRRIKSSIDSSISPSKREHLIYVDRQGNLRLPDEMRKEAKIQNHVVIRFDKDKGILEVIPRND